MKRLLVLLLLSVFLYCTHDKPLPNGYEMLDRQNKGQVIVKEYKATASAFFWQTPVTGARSTLLLGSHEQFQSRIAFRAINFANVVDTATVQQAIMYLTFNKYYGQLDSFKVNIYPITSAWVDNYDSESEWENAIWTDVENKIDRSTPLGSFYAFAADSDTVIAVDLDPAIINQWVNDENNYGMLFDFDDSGVMCQYYSTEASNYWPLMNLIYDPVDTEVDLDTVAVYFYNDVSLVQQNNSIPENELQTDPDMLHLGNASGYQSILQFNTSDIPSEATIHHSQLTLDVNTSKQDTSSLVILGVFPIVGDSTWNPRELLLDSLRTKPTGFIASDITPFEMDGASATNAMSTFVQHWAWTILPNYGLLLKPLDSGSDLSEIDIYSGKQDSSKTPRLRITYSLPPDSRFSDQ